MYIVTWSENGQLQKKRFNDLDAAREFADGLWVDGFHDARVCAEDY